MLDGDALLGLYQRGAASDALGRAALLAALAAGAEGEQLPLGELDRRIWALRAGFRGEAGQPATAEAVCPCPECGARLEFVIPADLVIPGQGADSAEVTWQGKSYRLRMPTLADFDRQGLRASRLGEGPWEDPGFAALAATALERADPALGFGFAMHCPDCDADFTQAFDPLAFFWVELAEAARQLVAEVCRLASAFGWAEQAILAMPPGRRALYLAEIGG